MSRKYINCFGEFFQHTKLHQKRVRLLGEWLYDNKTDYFDTVPKELLIGYLELHDQAKFLPVQRGYTLGATYLEHLYYFYGSNKNQASPICPATIVNEMNQLEVKLGIRYLDSHFYADASMTAVIFEKLKLVEHIADLVDRGKCPVSCEEFGYQLLPASQYLTDPTEIEMAKLLESNYDQIVSSWTFEAQMG